MHNETARCTSTKEPVSVVRVSDMRDVSEAARCTSTKEPVSVVKE